MTPGPECGSTAVAAAGIPAARQKSLGATAAPADRRAKDQGLAGRKCGLAEGLPLFAVDHELAQEVGVGIRRARAVVKPALPFGRAIDRSA